MQDVIGIGFEIDTQIQNLIIYKQATQIRFLRFVQAFSLGQGRRYWRLKMAETPGSLAPSLPLRTKISTTASTLSASRAKKAGSSANLLFCCTLQMLERAGKEYLWVPNFLGTWYLSNLASFSYTPHKTKPVPLRVRACVPKVYYVIAR